MTTRWLALLFLTPALLAAQAAPPVSKIAITAEARLTLDSLAKDARTHRTENGACLVAYTVKDSVLTLLAFGKATYANADSLSISTFNDAPICGSGIPSIHSHVAMNSIDTPSVTDRETATKRGIWNLLLLVRTSGYLLSVY